MRKCCRESREELRRGGMVMLMVVVLESRIILMNTIDNLSGDG